MIIAILGILIVAAVSAGPIISNVERPDYSVIDKYNNIEVRQYEEMIIAEVETYGQRKEAIEDGFRQLANYIFGNNIVQQDISMTAPVQQQKNEKISMTAPVQQQKNEKISMTAPVQQQRNEKIPMTAPVQQQRNEKIPMTAPVQQQRNEKIPMTAPVQQQSDDDSWRVSFVIPSQYTMETIPQPVNSSIVLKSIPAQQFVVIRFSGFASQSNLSTYKVKLLKYIEDNNILTVGSPKYAFYNPSWTLPILRRNEIMVEIQK